MAGQIRCRPARSAAAACSGARGPSKYISRAQAGACADAGPFRGGHDLVDLPRQRGHPAALAVIRGGAGLGLPQGQAHPGGAGQLPEGDGAEQARLAGCPGIRAVFEVTVAVGGLF
jgi:hypothetical protein